MPSLKDTLATSLTGYSPAPEKPPLPPSVVMPGKSGGNFSTNPSIRCPLPPFNIGPDTLRQFDQADGISPKRRVIPLPVLSQVGGGTTVVNNNTTSTNNGGGSSTVATLAAKTVVCTTPLLTAGQYSAQTLNMSKSYQLISVVANNPCEIRLYGSSGSQAADIGRPTDSPLPAELFNNLVTDIVLDTAPYIWEWQNRVGVNTNSPQSTSAYITVFNTGAGSAQIQLTLVYLPLES